MDVTFTNVLEGARQYFQGLPTGTNSAVSPAFSSAQHNLNDLDSAREMLPTSNSYWPTPTTGPGRPPTREHTPINEQSLNGSNSSRPPSHPQYAQSVAPDQGRLHYPVSYQSPLQHVQQYHQQPVQAQQQPLINPQHQDQLQHHEEQQHYQTQQQNFQFPRPHSREVPSNSSQYQTHISTSSPYHQPHSPYHQPASPYHQIPSPQLQRVPSKEQLAPRAPSREQPVARVPSQEQPIPRASSMDQLATQYSQAPDNFNSNYAQSRNYHIQSKPVPSNNMMKSNTANQSYPTTSQQQSIYYKHIYSPQSSQQNQAVYPNNTRISNNQEVQQNTHPILNRNDNSEQGSRTTHNLPPIAAISNYFPNRNEVTPRSIGTSNSRTRTYSSSSSTYSPNAVQQSLPVGNNASLTQQNSLRSHPQQETVTNYQSNWPRTSQNQQAQQPKTVTNLSYNQVVVTPSNNTPSYYPNPNQTQSSNQTIQNQRAKSNNQNFLQNPVANHTSVIQEYPQSHIVDATGKSAVKRESPLDLSVKTVRTPADSTLCDTETDSRGHYYQYNNNNRQAYSSISTMGYPQLDVSFQQNLAQRSPQLPMATAPKVEFHPNFNVPTPSQSSRLPKLRHNAPPEASNKSLPYDVKDSAPYQNINSNRYPSVSIPSTAHANSYIHSHISQKAHVAHSVPKSEPIYPTHQQDIHKKRPADVAPTIVPNKIPKVVDPWRQSIDMQIEERLSSYKQQQVTKHQPNPSRPVVNGNYPMPNQSRMKEMYVNYSKQSYKNAQLCADVSNQYQTQVDHNQTYVPSPANHPYPAYAGMPAHHSQPTNAYLHPASRSGSNSINTLAPSKNNLGGAVDKRVLSLLRNSLEVKGQKKLEQQKLHENFSQHVQHPSTDVTAPLQPKPGLLGRNNVSPFTPTNFPDNTNIAAMYKFPKAMDSVNFDPSNKLQSSMVDKRTLNTVITNHSSLNPDYDGLAAFLAARIRTKGELKQGGPTMPNVNTDNTSAGDSQLQSIIESQLGSPLKSELIPQVNSSSSSGSSKLSRDRLLAVAPRKRLFSRTEDEQGNNNVPLRDKSGLRSSSETSIFDFPDSDSDNERTGKESLESMRKGRKTSKQGTPVADIKLESPPSSPIPGDDIFAQLCDTFIDQLKTNVIKRKCKRKKPMEPIILANLETATKENPIENSAKEKINITKVEEVPEEKVLEVADIIPKEEPNESEEAPTLVEASIITAPESVVESDVILKIATAANLDVESKISEENQIIAVPCDLEIKQESLEDEKPKEDPSITTETEDKDAKSPQKRNDVVPIARPAKKPSFGDGSDFYPGWEEGVYKYKKSLRMPPTLIQVSRPPQFHRLSTSLPDLDPYPQSPNAFVTAENEKEGTGKTTLKKVKSEPLDSDNESSSSFIIFSKKTNYDSEGSASIKSLPTNTARERSILDKLLEKCGGRKKRKYKRKDDQSAKIIPKSENSVELLSTPSLEIKEENFKEKKKLSPVIKSESTLLGFRKTTINNFRDAFIKKANNIVGLNEQFTTVVLKSRTRKETRVLKQRATIKEVFGEDRPASAPPVTCVNDIQVKEINDHSCLGNLVIKLNKQVVKKENQSPPEAELADSKKPEQVVKKENQSPPEAELADSKKPEKEKLLDNSKQEINLPVPDKQIKTEISDEIDDEVRSLEDIIIKRDPDEKSETPSLDGDDGSISGKRKGKWGKMRRKLSSGFDYIRKKKKIKKEPVESESVEKKKKKTVIVKTPESIDDIQKEIKTWVLNKGIGETHLHRAARLGFSDVTAYCLENTETNPSPKDNAGYTPLHEACARGHLQIAKLLLLYGANPSESAQGGIRPLHEAVENGFVEIARLLLAYGADPTLATYSGLTPLALTNDEVTKEFLKDHLNDVEGEPGSTWISYGPATCFDPIEIIGFNALDDVPQPDPEIEDEDMEFEESECLLPNLYTIRGEPSSDRWVLLQDLSNVLKIKSRDALLRQICPPSTSSGNVNYKVVLKELKMSDF